MTIQTIQQVAKQTGLSEHTLRYYEKIGLIDPIPRGIGKQRQYREEDVEWIQFLVRLRSTGMSVEQMLSYAKYRRIGQTIESLRSRRQMLEVHSKDITDKIAELKTIFDLLSKKIALYQEWENIVSSDSSTIQKE